MVWVAIVIAYIALVGTKVRGPKDLTLFLLGVALFPLAGTASDTLKIGAANVFVAIFTATVIVGLTRRRYENRRAIIIKTSKPEWLPPGYTPTPPKAGRDPRRLYSPKNQLNNDL